MLFLIKQYSHQTVYPSNRTSIIQCILQTVFLQQFSHQIVFPSITNKYLLQRVFHQTILPSTHQLVFPSNSIPIKQYSLQIVFQSNNISFKQYSHQIVFLSNSIPIKWCIPTIQNSHQIVFRILIKIRKVCWVCLVPSIQLFIQEV